MNFTGKGLAVAVAGTVLFLAFGGAALAKRQASWENRITGITVDDAEREVVITVHGESRPVYTAYKQIDPLRITVDLSETDTSKISGPIEVGNGFISRIDVARIAENGRTIGRIEIGLEKPLDYDAQAEGSMMVVRISKIGNPGNPEEPGEELPELPPLDEVPPMAEMPPLEEAPPLEEVPPSAELPPLDEVPPMAEMPPLEEAPPLEEVPPMGEVPPMAEVPPLEEPPPLAEVPGEAMGMPGRATKLLDFLVDSRAGVTEIQIVGNGEIGDYSSFKLDDPPRLVVDIVDVGNLYPATEIPVASPELSMIRIGQHPDKVRLALDPAEMGVLPYDITRSENRLIIRVGEQVAPPPESVVVAEAPPYEATIEGIVPPSGPAGEEAMPPLEEVPMLEEIPSAPPIPAAPLPPLAPAAPAPALKAPVAIVKEKGAKFTGKKIDLEFREGDIVDALRIISDVAKLNIVTGDDVKGKITLKLINVPWDQALDLILKTHDLGMERIGNVVRIAPAEKLRKELQEKLKSDRVKEEIENLVTKIIPVNYGMANEYTAQIKGLLSPRGTVDIDTRTNVLIVKDIARNLDAAAQLVRSLDTQTPQVLIEARIVEANTRFAKDIGIQWGGQYTASAATGNPTGLIFPNSIGVAGGIAGSAEGGLRADPHFAVNLPAAAGAGAGGALGFTFGSINNTFSLDLRLSAMESAGEGKIVSCPKVLTLDNKQAEIKQGLSIPYETVSQSGTQTQFIDATLTLNVVPHITADRSIIMKIKAEKNAADPTLRSAGGVPSISKKTANTEVLVKDGETAVIGGIYTIEKTESKSGVPLLSKIPILGWFFQRVVTEDKRTELLIFITPRMVERKEA